MLPLDAAPAPAALAGAPLRRPEPALASQIHDGMPAAQPGGDLPDGADPSYDPLAAYRPAILRRDLSVGLVGAAIAFLIFVLLPASTMVGIGG